MKYYLYISDAKLEMLLPQITGENKRKSSWEFKLDLKLFSIVRKAEKDEDLGQIEKLEKVVSFIHQFGNVGTVDNPDEYVAGTMEMGWSVFNKATHYPPCVYFGGATEETVIGLFGSTKHLIGHKPFILSDNANESIPYADDIIQSIYRSIASSKKPARTKPSKWLHELYYQSSQQSNAATHTLEFLAKRLFYKSLETVPDNRKILIGTPLYVSLNT
ncbi:MAG TPA: hypothetical protein DC054_14855 [Blastocatellia bacterium]|nr:hypothetical protein [Blastocatellia bacterium]